MTPKPKPPALVSGKPNPADDGVTHINIYDQGKHPLGVMLSYFYEAPFVHPHYGPFKSIEGFLRYLRSGGEDDAFRTIPAVRAKAHMESAKKRGLYKEHKVSNLENLIFSANYFKIDQNPEIKKALISSTLPFENYFLWEASGVVPSFSSVTFPCCAKCLSTVRNLNRSITRKSHSANFG
jgi:hypothetical protein